MFRQGNNPMKIGVILFILIFVLANTFKLKQITENPVPYFSMTAIGAAAMIIELLLIFMFQSYYGYIYKYIGMIFAFFMLGCIIGGVAGYRFEKIKIRTVAIAAVILNLLTTVFFIACSTMGNAENSLLVLLIIIAGLVAGLTFNLAIDTTEISMLYSMDLTGGAIAGLLFGVFLLPVLGVTGTIIFNILILVLTAILNATTPHEEIKIEK
jgi:spermidine synthase